MTKFAVETKGYAPPLQAWIDWILEGHGRDGLAVQLSPEVVFHSPVVFTPQRGPEITMAYLMAAQVALGGADGRFSYTAIFDAGHGAMLEFETEIDGKYVNGVDIIKWDAAGKIVDFKVMVRPLQAVQAVHASMGQMLEQMKKRA
ncbi:MAG: nuclear transport factor 2 family protein [Pseudomonadota bacterium]